MQDGILVCVDQRDIWGFNGRVYHQKLKKPKAFCDIAGMVLKMEDVFSVAKYPKASTEDRKFESSKKAAMKMDQHEKETEQAAQQAETEERDVKGSKATFIVKVQYRQNATWQGQVIWTEKNQTKQFRSALELIKLIDSAVAPEDELHS